jgi:predicted transposase/invertase (TIGR01784 family)
MRYVDVTNDVAFRKIFGKQDRTASLISFLNSVLELEGEHQVVDVTISNPYQFPRIAGEKATVLDVKAVDQNGNHFVVEMQVPDVNGFAKRIQYYAYRDYSMQINRGDQYKLLKPTHFIGVLDFPFTAGPDYLSHHIVLDKRTGEHLLTDVQFFFVELEKFNKTESELTTKIDQWVYFLKHAQEIDEIPAGVTDEGLLQAYQAADRHHWTREEFLAYDDQFIAEEDARGLTDKAVMESQIIAIRALLETGKLSVEEIAMSFRVPLSFVLLVQQEMLAA